MFTYVKSHLKCMIKLTNIDCICTDKLSKTFYTELFLLSFLPKQTFYLCVNC